MSVVDLLSQLARMATAVPLAVAAELAPVGEEGVAAGWRELRNVNRAFERFWAAPRPTRSEPAGDPAERAERELVRRLEAADAGEPWDALWLREGLGFRRSEAAWDAGGRPRAVLPDTRWRLPLHTGMGLSLALRTLAPLTLPFALPPAGPGERSLADTVDRFDALCRKGSRDGCEEAAFEALGLVARVLHPRRVGAIDRLLRAGRPGRRESFWHGLGRGLYLTPAGSLPRMRPSAHALERARREAPDPTARRNALSGAAWALTLVNFRHPGVVASALRESSGTTGEARDDDALVDGVARATVVWADAVGPPVEGSADSADSADSVDRALEAFLDGRTAGRDGEGDEAAGDVGRWRDRVAPRCREALSTWLVEGRLPERFGDLFRASVPT